MENIIIKSFKAGKEGVQVELNKPSKLKGGNIQSKSFWVSWDKIGELLFEGYTKKVSVSERDLLRSEN